MPRGVKRTGDMLTGGSGDVNPQTFVIRATQTGSDVTTTVVQPLPIPRLPTSPGRNLVIEVIDVEFYRIGNTMPGPGNGVNQVLANLTTNPNAQPVFADALSDTRQISAAYWVSVANGVPVAFWDGTPTQKLKEDLTDQAGHGFLVATDNVYLHITSSNTGAPQQIVCRFNYRWKDVSLTEYIGIVQSQQ